jgi:cell wall-associated NlpC family hydrolase
MTALALALLLGAPPFWDQFRTVIQRHLGRPYVWGACGRKSFDCSGFVWRVMYDNGILIKRTTARKLYMVLPATTEQDAWQFGNIVFFDDLKHCGIVNARDSFYHAQSSRGTNLSRFDPFWRHKVHGVRRLKLPR